MPRGNRRSDAEVAANRARVLELIATEGMSATEAARELGIPERTARRLVGKARPLKKTVAVHVRQSGEDELSRRRRWEAEKDARQKAENARLTRKPMIADTSASRARYVRVQQMGFDPRAEGF